MESETEFRALDRCVLVVAKSGGKGDDWAAYVGAVKGKNHETEWQEVLSHGTKLDRTVAEAIFPQWATKYTWRY